VTKGIEDTFVYTSIGHPEETLWQPDRNAPWVSFLNEVAKHDFNADFWFSPDGTFTKGCRYCRRLRDGLEDPDHANGANPTRHVEAAGPNSSGCLAYDLVRVGDAVGIDFDLYSKGDELVAAAITFIGNEIRKFTVHNFMGDRKRFANSVVLQAPDGLSDIPPPRRSRGEQAQPLTAIAEDVDSISDPMAVNYAHGEALYSREEPMIANQAALNLMARRDLARLSSTNEYIEIELPLNAEAQKGMVIRVNGGDISDVRDHVFRIEYVNHTIQTQTISGSRTDIGAVYLRTEAPA